MDKQDIKNLKKRYLVWFYKTTKEALDKIERKFTQLEIDKFIMKELKAKDKDKRAQKQIAEFQAYILSKEMDGVGLKYEGKQMKPEYYFLELKLKAIEKVILKEFGKKGLEQIKALYEKEMTERILKSTEH
ncbi:MAG: hypothetical protein PHW54_06340 [Candidatus Omnitrophica bacterium]|nr:hypothetical protein [Candidatus Omnitrophota bacterium]